MSSLSRAPGALCTGYIDTQFTSLEAWSNLSATLVLNGGALDIQETTHPGGGGVLPYKRLMGMCPWMGSHFHDWID